MLLFIHELYIHIFHEPYIHIFPVIQFTYIYIARQCVVSVYMHIFIIFIPQLFCEPLPLHDLYMRVPGLPIRDCAGSSNNLAPRCPKLSAIDVTAKIFFERLYLVLGLAPICALSQLSVCSHTPTVHSPAISRFPCNFFQKWPFNFVGQHDSQVIWPSPGILL